MVYSVIFITECGTNTALGPRLVKSNNPILITVEPSISPYENVLDYISHHQLNGIPIFTSSPARFSAFGPFISFPSHLSRKGKATMSSRKRNPQSSSTPRKQHQDSAANAPSPSLSQSAAALSAKASAAANQLSSLSAKAASHKDLRPSSSSASSSQNDLQATIQTVWRRYLETTPQRTKLLDVFLGFLAFTGVLQFLYCVIGGNYVCFRFLRIFCLPLLG